MNSKNQFVPDYAVHPGEILEETLQARGISHNELSARCGVTPKHISNIVNGKASITPDVAIMLERILDVKASIWLNIDADFKLYIRRQDETAELDAAISWAKKFPVRELISRGFLQPVTTDSKLVAELLGFFNVGSVSAWEKLYKEMAVQFRKSLNETDNVSHENVAAWLKIGENKANSISTLPFNKNGFKSALQNIRSLTNKPPNEFGPELERLCAENGVAVVLVSEFPKTKICGATYWIGNDKAILMLSLRYRWADIFWFTFFHEAGHLILHRKDTLIVDGDELSGNSREDEANEFAANMLIPEDKYRSFIFNNPRIGKNEIVDFAQKLNIAPGIIVGRLQKEGRILFSWCNDLRARYELK